jgi:hypothetical protein
MSFLQFHQVAYSDRNASAPSRLNLSLKLSYLAAVVASLACVVTLLAALFLAGGHPPVADYVGVIAVPLAWLIALCGLALALSSRRVAARRGFLLAVALNIAAICAGFGIWILWPVLRGA